MFMNIVLGGLLWLKFGVCVYLSGPGGCGAGGLLLLIIIIIFSNLGKMKCN